MSVLFPPSVIILYLAIPVILFMNFGLSNDMFGLITTIAAIGVAVFV